MHKIALLIFFPFGFENFNSKAENRQPEILTKKTFYNFLKFFGAAKIAGKSI